MLTLNYAGDTAAEAPSQHLGLEDFERAGVRVAERRFGSRDTIFAPGDPDGQLYFLLEGTVRLYKIYGDDPGYHHEDGTDLAAIADGYISVTPLHFDLTHHPGLEELGDFDLDRLLQPAAKEV